MTEGETLVVLGASADTAGTYQRATKLGYRTIAVDLRPVVEIADEYLPFSCRAPERVAAALSGRRDIAGVLCPAAGGGLVLVAKEWLTRYWGLADVLPEPAVRLSVDKAELRRACARLGLAVPGWVSGRPGPDLLRAARHLRFPAVVKPVGGTGARGVVSCAGPGGLSDAFVAALIHSPSGRVLVEEYVTGTPLTIAAHLRDGAVAFHAVAERTLAPPPYFVTCAHLLPAALPAGADAALVDTLGALCAEAGYRHGPLTVDLVLGHDGRPHVLDLSIRVCGDGLSDAVESAYGVDLVGAAIECAAGGDAALEPWPPRTTLVRLLGSDRPGTLIGVEGATAVRAMPEVVDLQLFTEPGSRVEPYERSDRRLGQVVLSGGSVAALRAAEAAVRTTVRFRLAGQDDPVPLP